MVDVGGQRSERRKWIHCFQGVTSVIFFVAMSEYNQYLIEDPTVNRMHESIALFEEIVNSRWFESSSIILFLNKSDLFKEKIQKVDLKCLFPDYTGGLNYEAGCKFLNQAFMDLIRDKNKTSYSHITCATNTENIRFVFNSIKHSLLKSSVNDMGIDL
jgi:guanine nucleotide-binding protein subunit alpha